MPATAVTVTAATATAVTVTVTGNLDSVVMTESYFHACDSCYCDSCYCVTVTGAVVYDTESDGRVGDRSPNSFSLS